METQLRIWRNFCSHGICTRWQLHGKDEKREQIQVEALYFLFMFNRENAKEVYSTFDWGSDGVQMTNPAGFGALRATRSASK